MTRSPLTPEVNARLNGTAAEFPHREEAMDAYRSLWGQRLLSKDGAEKRELEKGMDGQQDLISHGPGSIWREFAASLPGFDAWWEREIKDMMDEHARRMQR